MHNIDEWHANHNMGLQETCMIRGYGPFKYFNIMKQYPTNENPFRLTRMSSMTGFAGELYGKRVYF